MHALLTSEKPSIRYGTIDIRISYYNIMSGGIFFNPNRKLMHKFFVLGKARK